MASNNQGGEGATKKSNRGFASMDPQRQREIASEGGRAAHEKGTAHEFTSEEAREAGRKGGMARSAANRARKSSESSNASGNSRSSMSEG
jgi:general stress protein YciG